MSAPGSPEVEFGVEVEVGVGVEVEVGVGVGAAYRSRAWPAAARVAVGLCLLVPLACGSVDDAGADDSAAASAPTGAASAPREHTTPTDAEAFLRLLAPLTEGPIRIRYRVEGPAELRGELELELAEGGRRREHWSLKMPPVEDPNTPRVEGTRVQNPAEVWTAFRGQAPTRFASPLTALAEAYLAATPQRREAIAEVVRGWQSALATARAENPGERSEVQGISCLQMQMAGAQLCLWETVGVPLRHQGSAFSLEAVEVERGVALPPGRFELPDSARELALAPAPPPYDLDPATTLLALERGDPSVLAEVLTPGLRPPRLDE